MTPPVTSIAFRPMSGISTIAASAAPTMEPKVLTLYTVPMARSPAPAPSSMRVISGSVMPAQNVAGSITARQMAYRASENSRYPSSVRASACSSDAIQSKLATYTDSVAMASAPITHCVIASARIGSRKVSARLRTQSAPSESPRMNADNMSSKECVALPSTSDSMRTQAIS